VKQLFLACSICMIILSCEQGGRDDDLEISIPVSVREIKPGPIEEYITTTATVNAIKNTVLQSEIEGDYRLGQNPKTRKTWSAGDVVKTGDILIHLVNPEYENNIKIESQKLNLDISRREYEKQQSLYEKGGVTLRELINAERTFVEAKYTYENAIIQLGKMKISSPFDGVIIDMPYYTPSTKISTGQTMAELMDFSQLYAEVYYPAKDLSRVQVGQSLRVSHYSLSSDTLWGKVTEVAPALNPETRSFKAKILVENEEHLLRPGMFVKVETIVAKKDSAIVVPKEIILSKRDGKTVYVVDKGAALRRILRTGLENVDQVEVIEGLEIDERLVIKGFETLRHRSKVKIVR